VGITDFIFVGVVIVLVAFSALKSGAKTKKALTVGARQFWSVLPVFVAVFGLIGLLEVLLTPKLIGAWLGPQQGVLAPLYAAVVGGLSAGPPAAAFPLGKYLLEQHAGVAAVGAMLISWTAVGTATLPAEIRFFGARFAVTRWVLAFVISIIIGLLMAWILPLMGWSA
jgi:uncharacterized membrane protein YraQ (UPF0718 family)